MKNNLKSSLALLFTLVLLFSAATQLSGCSDSCLNQSAVQTSETGQKETEYSLTNVPISRNGVELYLDRMTLKDSSPKKNILLTHGVTNSSHEFACCIIIYSLLFIIQKNIAIIYFEFTIRNLVKEITN